ncbi:hypothetical protein [Streptomyces xinghaiensis]|uniref:hypothetical protein n=1 Tax=Streptomyces xinghaiensis TaxID=1038928 RepID=UPI0002FCE3B5|nr:hypothetical protein [Streptomyces xinghaiensis]MZE80392.1 hypothetical protein [Streptomyces sp. SID5475]
MPQPEHSPQEWAAVAAIGREASSRACPEEREFFGDILTAYRKNPRKAARGGALRPPVGMGVDLALGSPQVLWLVSLLVSAVAAKVAEQTVNGLSRVTRERLMPLLRRRGRGTTEGRTGSGPEDGGPGLGAEEWREVRALLEAGAADLGVPQVTAERYVNAVMEALGGHSGTGDAGDSRPEDTPRSGGRDGGRGESDPDDSGAGTAGSSG